MVGTSMSVLSALAPQLAGAADRRAVPLTTIPVGTVATLSEVRDVESRRALRSLGLTDDCQVRLCKVSDPCIVQVGATRIGLSREVAEHLFVVPRRGQDR
jgi:Fe2+ transport system protein FeoA